MGPKSQVCNALCGCFATTLTKAAIVTMLWSATVLCPQMAQAMTVERFDDLAPRTSGIT